MLTEPHQSRIGAIKSVPMRRTRKRKPNVQVGEIYHCIPHTWETWKYPFTGLVEKVLNNTAVVTIIATHECDEILAGTLKLKTVIPLKNLEEIG